MGSQKNITGYPDAGLDQRGFVNTKRQSFAGEKVFLQPVTAADPTESEHLVTKSYGDTNYAGGGGGEANTASSAGAGTSVYYQKTGVDLELNGIKSENNLLTVTLDGTSHDIELTVVVGNIDHNALANYAVAQHRVINDAGTSATELWSSSKIGSSIPAATEYDGVFYARKTTNLTVTTSWQSVGWNSQVKYDTYEFTHSTSSSPEEITLDRATGYIIDIKIPCEYVSGTVGQVTYFAIKMQVDTGGGFADITGEVAYADVIHMGTSKKTIVLPMYYDASAGDKIRVQIKETGGSGTVRIATAGASIRIRTVSDGVT